MLLSIDIFFHIPWDSYSLSWSVNDMRCRMWRTPIFPFQQQLWKQIYNMLNAPISDCGKIVQSAHCTPRAGFALPAITLSAHARDHLIVLELILILFSNILGLSWSEWCNKPAVGLLHPEYAIAKASTQNQLSFHLFVGCPSDDLTGENKSKSQESTHTPLLGVSTSNCRCRQCFRVTAELSHQLYEPVAYSPLIWAALNP
jgi:hypothetical protein